MQQTTTRPRGCFNGEETDTHSKHRHVHTSAERPGYSAAVKRRTNRRERQDGKKEIRQYL